MSVAAGLGAALFLLGLGYRWRPLARWDIVLFRRGHRRLRNTPWLWRALWPLGTTVFTLVVLGGLALAAGGLHLTTRNPADIARAGLVYLALAAFESAIKRLLRRPRPFTYLGGVTVNQPRRPRDPSFPSGDAMRVWFLAFLLTAFFGNGIALWSITLTLATLVSLGRIALGVHHPLDVLAGAGLGLLGFALWAL